MGTTSFKGFDNIGEPSYTEVLEDNIISYIDWCFLNTGAYFNIHIPSSGAYGGNRHRLRPVSDPRYTNGQVWEAYHKNWVWESGLNRAPEEQPISVSGIYVNNSFLPINSGYYIDYINGRVIFTNPIAINSVINIEYSHKWITIVSADEIPWFREGHTRSFRIDDAKFLAGSGLWSQLSDTRLELPIVAVEPVANRTYQGYQLGGGQWCRTTVVLHVLAEDSATANRISNALSFQAGPAIFMYDSYMVQQSGAIALDYKGALTSNPTTYPNLIKMIRDGGYLYNKVSNGKLYIYNASEQIADRLSPNLYHNVTRWETEAILCRI